MIAWRYLRGAGGGRRGRGILRFVTFGAVGGVAIGTAALLLALSIVRGFSREIEEKIVGFGTHVQVESYLGEPLARADTLAPRLASLPGVRRVTPAIVEFALLRGRSEEGGPNIDGVLFWGTPPGGQPFIREHLTRGRFSFARDAEGRPGLVLGQGLAERFGVGVGDRLTAFSTRSLVSEEAPARPRVRQFHVAGLYETGLADFDDRFVFLDLEGARQFFGYGPEEVTRLDLVLDDLGESPALAARISESFGVPVFARSVFDVFRNLFAWVRLQQSIVPMVISVLVLVGAFNIIGALLMVILERTREIGILLGMGASRAAVRRLFVWLGFLIGAVGATLGAVLAFGFALVQLRFKVIPLPQEAYYLDAAPVELRALDFVWVAGLAIALCTLAAWVPARVAARVEPVRSIHFGV